MLYAARMEEYTWDMKLRPGPTKQSMCVLHGGLCWVAPNRAYVCCTADCVGSHQTEHVCAARWTVLGRNAKAVYVRCCYPLFRVPRHQAADEILRFRGETKAGKLGPESAVELCLVSGRIHDHGGHHLRVVLQ